MVNILLKSTIALPAAVIVVRFAIESLVSAIMLILLYDF